MVFGETENKENSLLMEEVPIKGYPNPTNTERRQRTTKLKTAIEIGRSDTCTEGMLPDLAYSDLSYREKVPLFGVTGYAFNEEVFEILTSPHICSKFQNTLSKRICLNQDKLTPVDYQCLMEICATPELKSLALTIMGKCSIWDYDSEFFKTFIFSSEIDTDIKSAFLGKVYLKIKPDDILEVFESVEGELREVILLTIRTLEVESADVETLSGILINDSFSESFRSHLIASTSASFDEPMIETLLERVGSELLPELGLQLLTIICERSGTDHWKYQKYADLFGKGFRNNKSADELWRFITTGNAETSKSAITAKDTKLIQLCADSLEMNQGVAKELFNPENGLLDNLEEHKILKKLLERKELDAGEALKAMAQECLEIIAEEERLNKKTKEGGKTLVIYERFGHTLNYGAAAELLNHFIHEYLCKYSDDISNMRLIPRLSEKPPMKSTRNLSRVLNYESDISGADFDAAVTHNTVDPVLCTGNGTPPFDEEKSSDRKLVIRRNAIVTPSQLERVKNKKDAIIWPCELQETYRKNSRTVLGKQKYPSVADMDPLDFCRTLIPVLRTVVKRLNESET